jgi:hypothetical protein
VRRALALAALLLPAFAGLDATPAAAQAPPAAAPSAALLTGQFLLAGRVTVAHNIKGERVGDRAMRTWTFSPGCQAGACETVRLVRQRGANLSDTVILRLLGPGEYGGAGLFYAPLRCAGHTYARGESVPFTIDVHVTAAALILGVDVATQITATYENRTRMNRTRCVDVPGHDAATYNGHLVLPPSGGAGAVSDRSPAGS